MGAKDFPGGWVYIPFVLYLFQAGLKNILYFLCFVKFFSLTMGMSIIYLKLYLSDYGDKRLFLFLSPIKNDPNKNCVGFRGTVGPKEPSILL
jgi:hypothetical protein